MRRLSTLALALPFLFSAVPARAQTIDVRAQGMGGAFTGVADDASAVYWNPAGLASGAYFSGVVDVNSFRPDSSGALAALAMPPLGFSYYRTRSETAALTVHYAGVTLDQSLPAGLAVGATFQVAHGVVADRFGSTKFNMNVGVMESGDAGRIGLTIRNLLQPAFDAPGASARLNRQVRIGGSVNLTDATLLAADADLTTTNTTGLDRREAAVGMEQRLGAKAVVRGGFHWNTRLRGSAASAGHSPEGSAGASYAVYGRTSVDAQVTLGSKNGDRGWGIGLRMTF